LTITLHATFDSFTWSTLNASSPGHHRSSDIKPAAMTGAMRVPEQAVIFRQNTQECFRNFTTFIVDSRWTTVRKACIDAL
jgi:hypothetical protein